MSKQEFIIYVSPDFPSFVRNDIAFLTEKYHVISNTYNWARKVFIPFYMLHQIFFFVFRIQRISVIIVSLGGYWSFIPSLLGKIFKVKVFQILNGTDCASFPSLNYGNLRKSLLRYVCHYSYKLASFLIPVSSSLIKTRNTYYLDGLTNSQGYKFFFPDIYTPSKVIHNGFDIDYWKMFPRIKKQPYSFIAVFAEDQFILKGGDLILEIANEFKECEFYIAGCNKPQFVDEHPANIMFLGKISQDDLRDYYNKCNFHFQLSIFEGFGCALAEAMLCECIPIGSNVNIIPEIIGNTGYILKKRDSQLLKEIINHALFKNNNEQLGVEARKRIVEKFNLHKRKEAFINLIDNSLGYVK